MPNPGDAGSSLGAIANIKRTKLNWINPYRISYSRSLSG